MNEPPDTRPSLLVRVRDASDNVAWQEFTEIYQPVIRRLATSKGMQHADAEDLAQQVLIAVANAIGRWEEDERRARFRTWLRRVADLLANVDTSWWPPAVEPRTGEGIRTVVRSTAGVDASDLLEPTGDVQVETLEGLDVVVVRGTAQDVESFTKFLEQKHKRSESKPDGAGAAASEQPVQIQASEDGFVIQSESPQAIDEAVGVIENAVSKHSSPGEEGTRQPGEARAKDAADPTE